MNAATQLYRHFDSSGALLYVGISLHAAKRLSQHRDSSGWFPQIANVTIEKFETKEAALRAEREAILNEKPQFNIAVPTCLPEVTMKSESMGAAEYRAAIASLGLSQVAAAAFLGVSIRTAHAWANGEPIPTAAAKLLRLMARLNLKPEDVR